ncbi:cell division protein PerM [Sciscionella sediminilitoris]|uniref:cell division protein PerM n=1 Tax=Sciscionella sediminilitoris TaxID=1445613 RepID=UPI0006901B2C|nr:DUF6350 family protein [Sciscionella sp. SE31]
MSRATIERETGVARARRTANEPDELLRAPRPSIPVLIRSAGLAYLGALLAGYAVCAAIAAVVLASAPNAPFSAGLSFGSALLLWLGANHVPLTISGAELGVLPLALTLLFGWFLARAARTTVRRRETRDPAHGGVVCAVLAGSNAIAGAVIAGCVGGASPVTAFFACAVLGGLAALLGVLRDSGILDLIRDRLGPLGTHGVRLGIIAVFGLIAMGAVTFALASLVCAGTGASLFELAAPGAGSGFGMLLLCLGYLPNAAIAGLSFAAGPGFSLGTYSASPVGFHGGAVPPMPLLAALPDHFSVWWLVFFALPLMAGAAIGWLARTLDESPIQRLRIIAIAALVAAVFVLVLAALAGGALGAGAVDPVVVPAGGLALAVFGWIGLVGGTVTWFAGPSLLPESVPDAEDEQEPDLLGEFDDLEDSAEAAEPAEPVEEEPDSGRE